MFTDEELGVILQALSLAQYYYEDANRVPPQGMAKPNEETVKHRLEGVKPLIERIVDHGLRKR